VTKLNASGSAFIYSTYLGGSKSETGYGIAADGSGSAYVTGFTISTDFPTANAVQASYGGGTQDAFVTKLNPDGSALVYSTYLGGSGSDYGNGIAVDSSGSAYVTGTTDSTDFPAVNALQATYGGAQDAFVSKIVFQSANVALTMQVSPATGGTTVPGPGTTSESLNSVVHISATPAVGYGFVDWSPASAVAAANNPNTTVVMTQAETVTANFAPLQTVPLTMQVSPATGGTTVPGPGTTSENLNSVVHISATPAVGYGFVDWSPASVVGAANNPNTTVAMTQAETVTANFAPLQTTIGGNITAKSGSANARVWTLSLTNNGPGVANGTTIHNFSLTQTFGAACTPGVSTAFPISLGNLQPGQTVKTTVTLNFASCVATSRYTAKFTYVANGGTVSGTVSRYNQYE
jgi:hypothetical protein